MKSLLTIRNGIGACLMVAFFKLGNDTLHRQALGTEAMIDRLLPSICAISCLVLAACFFSRTLTEIFSRPFSRLIDGIYFGSSDREPPPVTLKLAGVYRRERRYEDAIGECERQLEYHPRSVELWSEMIRAARESGDAVLAEKFERRARRRLRGMDQERLRPGAAA